MQWPRVIGRKSRSDSPLSDHFLNRRAMGQKAAQPPCRCLHPAPRLLNPWATACTAHRATVAWHQRRLAVWFQRLFTLTSVEWTLVLAPMSALRALCTKFTFMCVSSSVGQRPL